MKIGLPAPDGTLVPYAMGEPRIHPPPGAPSVSRVAYAAAHVVADPDGDPPGSSLDWDATLAFRRHLWSYGLGVAEAMDTAQRGMGLDWATTRSLIERSGGEARAVGGRIVCGAGTDHLPPGPVSLGAIAAAYEEQLAVVESAGAVPVLMASRHLAAAARGPDDYAAVYGRLLAQVERPVVLHWLGPMFDPALDGYWGSADPGTAAGALLALIEEHAPRIDGVKISLLDAEREIAFRNRLPSGVRLYTGDDFNYPELIRGDADGHSDALLGVFDPIAPAAAAALRALDDGDTASYEEILAPTVPLARHLFEAPTYYYKTGVVFLAWLTGRQRHFRMVGGLENARPVPHMVRLFQLADAAGLFPDPGLAARRMSAWLTVQGAA
ncbi:dihydrodipicolinate synthase family protein [Actinomadura chibensis]|uniref:Dihydrodipicolinate synthase family protein n=1 Tax=Actinomadura chibensis TaxID=392828 RepID=A0A5D0NCE7_9ACTN|nr:dihydrodipicolinate synthase family protein [Actinomadura chibensis]TYB41875.1 dihydrodipicolinate synthase family protein [Actinomadura chibensis]